MLGMSKCKKFRASSTNNKSLKIGVITTKRWTTGTQCSNWSKNDTTRANESTTSNQPWTTKQSHPSRGKKSPSSAIKLKTTIAIWTNSSNSLQKHKNLFRSSHRPCKKTEISSVKSEPNPWLMNRMILHSKTTWRKCAQLSSKMSKRWTIMSISQML